MLPRFRVNDTGPPTAVADMISSPPDPLKTMVSEPDWPSTMSEA